MLLTQLLLACALVEPAPEDARVPRRDAGPGSDEEVETSELSDPLAAELGGEPQAEPTETPPHAPQLAPDASSPDDLPNAADAGLDDPANVADARIESEGDGGASCEADWQCGADAYCSRVSRRCSARCQAESCVGPTISDTNHRLVSDGSRVCFADDSEAPGSGDFALRLWDGIAPRATTLTRASSVQALLLDDQYCYFHAAGALRRAALSGGCVELLQELKSPPARIWSVDGYVAWRTAEGSIQRVANHLNARAEAAPTDVEVPEADNVYAGTTVLGPRSIQRHAAEGRLLATQGAHAADAGTHP